MRISQTVTIVSCCAGLLLSLRTPSLLSQSTEAKVTYSLRYSQIDATEPVVLKLELTNVTNESLEMNLGWRDQIYFTATGSSGRMEIHEPPPNTFDQVGRFGKVVIAPKGTYTQSIVLSQWASFDRPGDYTLEIHLRGPLGLQNLSSLQVQSEAVRLSVVTNAAPLVQRHCVEEWNRLQNAQNGGEAMDVTLFLGNVSSPLAVPFMSAALDTEHSVAIGGILITGLERIGDLNAVHALVQALNSRAKQNSQIAHDALARIALANNVSPEVAKEARLA